MNIKSYREGLEDGREESKEKIQSLTAQLAECKQERGKTLIERVAQITAHRACHSAEHDPANGKLHGFCVVCGVPFPCSYVGAPPKGQEQSHGMEEN